MERSYVIGYRPSSSTGLRSATHYHRIQTTRTEIPIAIASCGSLPRGRRRSESDGLACENHRGPWEAGHGHDGIGRAEPIRHI
jgi:hypothetical protein